MAENVKTRVVDPHQVHQLGMLQCTQKEAAAFFNISLNAFRRLMAREPKVRQAWERGLDNGRISLRRKQMRLANTHPAMAIFLGKQYLSQRDVQTNELTGKDGKPMEFSGKIQVEFVKSNDKDSTP